MRNVLFKGNQIKSQENKIKMTSLASTLLPLTFLIESSQLAIAANLNARVLYPKVLTNTHIATI